MKETHLKQRSGIYVIEHLDSGRVYVGQAQNIYARWIVHRCFLRSNKHHCRYLQNVWNKYGESAFRFRVVQFGEKETLDQLELKWFTKFSNLLFNLRPPGKSARGYTHTEKSKAKMKESAKKSSNTIDQKLLRSERAKRQHQEGFLKRAVVNPIKRCERCNKEFPRYRKHKGGYYNGKHCLFCAVVSVGLNGGTLNLDLFDITVDQFDELAYELNCVKRFGVCPEYTRVILEEGKPKQKYPGAKS